SLAVPLLRESAEIGAISIRRTEVRPFTERQVALLKTFADQAVIAIENVRLFTELQQKNEALTQAHAPVTETLEKQTATSEILRVISSSPTDVRPVFNAIISSASRLFGGDYACVLHLIDGDVHMIADNSIASAEWAARTARTYPHPLAPGVNAADTAMAERRIVHIPDLEAEHPFAGARRLARTMGYHSVVFVPMIREGAAIGAIAV